MGHVTFSVDEVAEMALWRVFLQAVCQRKKRYASHLQMRFIVLRIIHISAMVEALNRSTQDHIQECCNTA
jgi:deoxyadenosine/deoxycytidine kinase